MFRSRVATCHLWLLFLLVWPLAACDMRPSSVDSGAAASDAPAAQTPEGLLTDVEGVWVAREEEGGEALLDGRDMYMFWREDGALRVFQINPGPLEWQISVDDVDVVQGVLTIKRTDVNDRPSQTDVISLSKMPMEGDTSPGRFWLRMDFGDGMHHNLDFVRRVAPADMEKLQETREAQRQLQEHIAWKQQVGVDCLEPKEFRAREVCANEALLLTHGRLSTLFSDIARTVTDKDGFKKTEAIAWRQLDECRTIDCLDQKYVEWEKYLQDNYAAEIEREVIVE